MSLPNLAHATPEGNFAASEMCREPAVFSAISGVEPAEGLRCHEQIAGRLKEIIATATARDGEPHTVLFTAKSIERIAAERSWLPQSALAIRHNPCRRHCDWKTKKREFETDLESVNQLRDLRAAVDEFAPRSQPTLVVVDRLLEQLDDLRPVLNVLRTMLQRHSANRLLVIHDEVREHGPDTSRSRSAVRRWKRSELEALFRAAGFDVAELPKGAGSAEPACFSCTASTYEEFLRLVGLPPSSIRYLVVTTETAESGGAFGIGSYVAELQRLFSKTELAVLACRAPGRELLMPAQSQRRYIAPEQLFGSSGMLDLHPRELAWITLQQALLYYAKLELIEYQDFLGLGARIVQAKRAGLVEDQTVLRTRCLGSHYLSEAAAQRWLDLEGSRTAEYERIALEGADEVAIATISQRQIYEEAGIIFNPATARIRMLPLPTPRQEQGLSEEFAEAVKRNRDFVETFFRSSGDQARIDAAIMKGEAAGMNENVPLTVIVPLYDVRDRFIDDLCRSLNAQLHAPQEVIFIDDGSADEYAEAYRGRIAGVLRAPFRIVRNDTNCGPAAARNRGLTEVKTPIVVNLDSDDIALPRYLKEIHDYLAQRDDIAAATHFIQYFRDEDGPPRPSLGGDLYRPLGQGLALGQLINCFASQNIGFRTDRLRTIGGWDTKDRSKWVDWELFLRMGFHGAKIGVIPAVGCLVRVHESSMSRLHPDYPAARRLARAIPESVLPRYDALRLQGLLRHAYSGEVRRVNQRRHRMSEIPHSAQSHTARQSPPSFAASETLIPPPEDLAEAKGPETVLCSLQREDPASFFTSVQQLTVETVPDGIRLTCSGNDPQSLLKTLTVPPHGTLIIGSEIYNRSTETVKFQIFYRTLGRPEYSEDQSMGRMLKPGKNSVVFRLSAAGLLSDSKSEGDSEVRLRIDPADRPAELIIHSFEVRHAAAVEGSDSSPLRLAAEKYCLKAGYLERGNSRTTVEAARKAELASDTRIVHQPEVYRAALETIIKLQADTFIDVGCSGFDKLSPFVEKGVRVVGIGGGAALDLCRERYPRETWLNIDLESISADAIAPQQLQNAVIVASQTVERLADPSAVLSTLRQWARVAKCVFIATPERVLVHGVAHGGPPANPAHVREWSEREFLRYLSRCGLTVKQARLTRSVSIADVRDTLLVTIDGTERSH